MNFRDVDKLVKSDGWYPIGQRGSHHYYKHPIKPGKLTIPEHRGRDIHPDTLQSIKKQARLI